MFLRKVTLLGNFLAAYEVQAFTSNIIHRKKVATFVARQSLVLRRLTLLFFSFVEYVESVVFTLPSFPYSPTGTCEQSGWGPRIN